MSVEALSIVEKKKMLLKEWRWKKMLEQTDVAEKLQCSQAAISRIENGDLKPTIQFRRTFIAVYGEEEAKKILELDVD